MLSPEERWLRRIKIAIFCVVAALIVALTPHLNDVIRVIFNPKQENMKELQAALGAAQYSRVLVVLVGFAAWKKFFTIAQAAARFIDDPRSEAAKGSMHDVRSQLAALMRQATRGRRRLVIFVDDLERCKPPRAVEVCEVASQLLGNENVVTVLIADMATIAVSAQIKYAALEVVQEEKDINDSPTNSYGRLYLQKIVQIQFELPTPEPQDIARMVGTPVSRVSTGTARKSKLRRLFSSLSLFAVAPIYVDVGLLQDSGSDPVDNLSELLTDLLGFNVSRLIVWVVAFLAVVKTLDVVIAPIYQLLVRWFQRANRRRIDNKILEEMKGGETDAYEIGQAVIDSDVASDKDADLVHQRVQHILTEESTLRKEAEAELFAFLPVLPRSAKRMTNHLRLLFAVALGRRMFGGTPPLKPRHLGKWVALLERWPELGPLVRSDASRMARLEGAATIEELAKAVQPAPTNIVVSWELFMFLRSSLALAPVVERLIHFTPAEQR